MQQIILASQSPRRKQLLEWASVSFEVVTKTTDETYPEELPVNDIPVFIAREKALAVKKYLHDAFHATHTHDTILAADTVVVLNNEIIGKPKDRADAIRILSLLANKTHHVITGVVILHHEKEITFAETTEVIFHPLTQEQIEFYVDEYKPYDKAGAYAIQEWIGLVGISKINGDFYNVMGLPVSKVLQALKKLNN
jgi:septum formation protein